MSFLERSLASYAKNEVITPYIEEALIKANWPEEYKTKVYNKERIFDGYFHPSSDVMAGDYQLYYKFHPKYHDLIDNERITPTSELTFQIGSAFHAIGEAMLIHLGFTSLEECEVAFRNEDRKISGTTDIRILTLPNGRKFLVDIKTANIIPKEVSEAYALQTMIYQDNVPGAPAEMALLFFQKSYPHQIRDFVIVKDQEKLKKVYDKWDRVRVAISTNDTKELKRCCGDKTDEKYMSCPAKHICKFYNNE